MIKIQDHGYTHPCNRPRRWVVLRERRMQILPEMGKDGSFHVFLREENCSFLEVKDYNCRALLGQL